MFRIPNAPVHLPSNQAIATLEADALRRESAITDDMLRALEVPEHYGTTLREEWDATYGQKDRYVEVFCHESREGTVLLTADNEDGPTDVRLVILSHDEEDEEDEEVVLSASEKTKWTEEDKVALAAVWTPFYAVGQIKAEAQVAPNAPCPCKSGKKAKKCCQRFV